MHGTTERGVSDVVAFALVFAMVITVVSATFVLGVDGIEAFSNDGQMQTAENQMDAVAATFDDVHRRGSVARSVEVELDGGTLELTDSSVGLDVGSTGSFATYQTGSLELRRPGGVAAYELGAVTRENDDGSGGFVKRAPAVYCGSSTAILSIVEFDSSEPISIAGEDSLRIIGTLDSQTVTSTSASSVRIDISAVENRAAWRQYLGSDETDWSGSGDQFTCSGVSKVIVRTTVIDLDVRR